jgi:hypothetical protein
MVPPSSQAIINKAYPLPCDKNARVLFFNQQSKDE